MVVILLKRLGFGTLIGAFIALIGVIVVLSVRMVRSLDSYMKRGPRRSSIRMPPAGPPTLCRSNVPCKRIGPRLAIARGPQVALPHMAPARFEPATSRV